MDANAIVSYLVVFLAGIALGFTRARRRGTRLQVVEKDGDMTVSFVAQADTPENALRGLQMARGFSQRSREKP